jgi:anti-sigma factor ChrR (cupin superfamily)
MSSTGENKCPQAQLVSIYALGALPESEAAAFEAHLASCPECSHELQILQPAVDALSHWPTDVLRPAPTLWSRLVARIGAKTTRDAALSMSRSLPSSEWEDVAPGIACKLLATGYERDRVSMLVRLAPGAHYPPHVHAGVEELHLLDGELWVDDVKMHPGDYRRAEAGTADRRIWSETGCTCVLITSPRDSLS